MGKAIATAIVLKAARFAVVKHEGQTRKSKDKGKTVPYITHPMAVSRMLAENGCEDEATLAAALLHDTLEDTETTYDELAKEFGAEIADIVLELTDDKSLPKAERKAIQLQKAAGLSTKAKHVKLGDKTHNALSVMELDPGWSVKAKLGFIEWSGKIIEALDLEDEYPVLHETFRDAAEAVKLSVANG